MASIPLIRAKEAGAATGGPRFGRHAALAFLAAGRVMLGGTIIDLGVLWIGQRQANPQWEFVAVANTLDAFPRLVLSLALLVGALYLGDSGSLLAYRILAAGFLLLGVAGAGLGGLMVTDYLALRRAVNPEGYAVFRSTAFKAAAVSALYVVVLLPLGIKGLRGPKRS